ncbi:MAG: hypothetical protein Q7S66_03895 [bacterium]|nr:hypothetical protein [bacterium]
MSARKWQNGIIISILATFTTWWLFIAVFVPESLMHRQLWSGTYGLAALFGAVAGLINFKAWGGMKSVVGKSMVMFSLGLFCQEFGQVIFSYYAFFVHIDVPYPSLADVGYFSALPLYIYGAYLLNKWIKSLEPAKHRSGNGATVVSLCLLVFFIISIPIFFHGFNTGNMSLNKALFSYIYLLSDTLFVLLAVKAYFLSRQIPLDNINKPVFIFVLALCFQYLADYTFFAQVSYGTWIAAGLNDLLYFTAYCFMAIGLVHIRVLVEATERVTGFNKMQQYFVTSFFQCLRKLRLLVWRYGKQW